MSIKYMVHFQPRFLNFPALTRGEGKRRGEIASEKNLAYDTTTSLPRHATPNLLLPFLPYNLLPPAQLGTNLSDCFLNVHQDEQTGHCYTNGQCLR